jgi:hypothetical protein
MAFALSSSVITQTGTDTTLAGLSGVTGVVTNSNLETTTYTMPYQLKVTGTLTHKANEYLEITASSPDLIVYVFGGIYTIEGYISNADLSQNLGRPQLLSTRVAGLSWRETYGVRVQSGTLNINGGYLKVNGALNTMNSASYLNISNGAYEGGVAGDGNKSMIRAQFGGHIDVDGFIAYNTTNALTAATSLSLLNYSPRDNQEGILDTNSAPLVLVDYAPENNTKDAGFFGRSNYLVYGFKTQEPKAGVHINSGAANGVFELRKNINFAVKNLSGSALSDCVVYMKDTIQSTTRSYSSSSYVSLVSGNQVLNIDEYSETTGATGLATIDKMLSYTGIFGGENVGVNSQPLEPLYKTKATDFNFADDATIIAYNYLIQTQLDIDLAGLGESEASVVLFLDPLITQPVRATVDAYSTLDDSLEFYDRAKSNLYTNFAGQIATLVTRSGNLTDAGAYNVNIDATAGVAFAISGNTITIKTSTFVGDMVTTGVITLLNGALFNGTRTDVNGTVAPPVTLTITGLIPNSEVRIYDNEIVDFGNNNTELYGIEDIGATTSWVFVHAGVTNAVKIQILAVGYEEALTNYTLESASATLAVSPVLDTNL